ncbi:MAG: sensory histidine kinase AtoS [Methanobacterium sp. PtaB.Bin024]|jgi:PAS domain S-box-containing protein|nr:MAG: sensory histidine kinase AtoS [Methanobacterium sp. PtaB.Bin024]
MNSNEIPDSKTSKKESKSKSDTLYSTLLSSDEAWELSFNAIPDLIALIDKDFNIKKMNKAMAEFVKDHDAIDILGSKCYRIIHGTEEPPDYCPNTKLLEDEQSHVQEFHEDNLNRDFIVTVNPIFDENNQILGSVHIVHDDTERKKSEKLLEQSLKEKEMLLKEIHHRVKNNLMIISSLLNLQSRYLKDEESREIFKESQNRAKSMALIHQRLYESTDLKNIGFKEYITTLANELYRNYVKDPSRVSLELEIEDVNIDINNAIPLGLILNELITNAMKYAFPDDEKGIINVSFCKKGDKYILKVADNGKGFPKDLDYKKSDSLGLQLVTNLSYQINGEIELDRTEGTAFILTFTETTIS